MNRKDMHIKKYFLMEIIIIPMNMKNNVRQDLRSLLTAFFPNAFGKYNSQPLFKIILQQVILLSPYFPRIWNPASILVFHIKYISPIASIIFPDTTFQKTYLLEDGIIS